MDKDIAQKINNFNKIEKYIRGLISWLGYVPIVIEYVREDRKKGKTTATLRLFTYFGVPI